MKKTTALLLAVLMLMSFALTGAALPTEPEQTGPVAWAVEEEKLSATITLTSTEPIDNGTITLEYPRELELVSAESEIASADGVNAVNDGETGAVTVSWATLGTDTADKLILKVVLSGQAGRYSAYVNAETLANGTEDVEMDELEIPFTLSGTPETGGGGTTPGGTTPGGTTPGGTTPGGTTTPGTTPSVTPDPSTHVCHVDEFTDVSESAWYHEAVDYVVEKKLMNGVSDTAFMPESGLTRAMVVTVLSRAAGIETSDLICDFTDVAAGSWYAGPVAWADAEGIVTGLGDGTFHPGDLITRQDMVTILYRFAQKYMDAGTVTGGLDSFADAAGVAGYAREAMAWAVNTGVVNGVVSGDTVVLLPAGTATRAQFAQVILKLYEGADAE